MNNSRLTLFLGGCPGVGKSFLARQLESLGFRHEVAGRLIRRGIGTDSETYQRPVVANDKVGDRFQRILIEEFRSVRTIHEGVIVLDGHFVLPTRERPIAIPPNVFDELQIGAFILLEAPLTVIMDRLRSRGTQEWWNGTEESLSALIKAEHMHAKEIACLLERPLLQICGEDSEGAVKVRDWVLSGTLHRD